MAIGAIAISTSQKKEPSGAPLTAGSARNGTSIDSTGHVVLGNDVGDPAQPAILLSDREIVMEDLINSFVIILNAAFSQIRTRLEGAGITIDADPGTFPFFRITGGAGAVQAFAMTQSGGGGNTFDMTASGTGINRMQLISSGGVSTVLARGAVGTFVQAQVGADQIQITGTGTGHVSVTVNGVFRVIQINTSTFNTQISPSPVADNGAALQVTGTLTNRRIVSSKAAGTYNVDRDLDSGKFFTNSAANNFQLPFMNLAQFREGFIFRVTVNDVGGVTVTADVTQIIRFGAGASSAGGTISSVTVGSALELTLLTGGIWVTNSFTGTWVTT